MQFTDAGFLFLFLPIALLLHRIALVFSRGTYGLWPRLAIFGLTLCFYGAKQHAWLIPFAVCVVFDFTWATLLARTENPRARKVLLGLSITQNVVLLAVFKYGGGIPGISFYVFESLSFVVDVYCRRIQPPKRVDEFFAFIGMFPRFVAGPIVRYRDMVSQFSDYKGMQIEPGLNLFAKGLFLKCVFADSFALFVPHAFQSGTGDFATAWLSTIAYAMQIYFDFSGYSLMAIGLGLCLGFQFPENFRQPYLARDLQDFWRRWHISLSTWLRDYLYIPLGGNQKGKLRTYFNLFVTMLLGGLWHGGNWTFLVWGGLHGTWLCVERRFLGNYPAIPKRVLALLVVLVGWVFFRAENIHLAGKVLTAMFDLRNIQLPSTPIWLENPGALALALAGLAYCFMGEPRFEMPTRWRWSFAVILFAAAVPIGSPDLPPTPFLYFQF